MSNKAYSRVTITSALPYANGPVHIGQLAGAYIPADVYARYQRLKRGDDNVLFICGSDEHGMPITMRARKEEKSPQAIVDHYHCIIKKSFEELGVSFNIYHRTSADLHKKTAQEFFLKLYEKGLFIEKESEQYYDEEYNQFLADRYIMGTCPNCGFEEAYGDQCENCGKSLSPSDLINPHSTLSGNVPVKRKTRHWFLPLDSIQKNWLDKWVREESQKVEPWKRNVYGQCLSWLDQGLQPRAMTRDLDWGVSVPLEDADGKVMYVWFDAPIGYISAAREWARKNQTEWESWWQDPDSKLVHFLGKDNIVFHTIIFPALLKEHGDFNLPTNVPANEFMNLEGRKMSTSRNWTVWLHEYLAEIPNKQDELRYTLLTNLPEAKDSEFTWKDFQSKVNSELVATLGNFVNRIIVLSQKYFDGECRPAADLNLEDHELIREAMNTYEKVGERIETYNIRQAMEDIMAYARECNRVLTEEEPWKKIKTDEDAVRGTLWVCAQAIGHLGAMLEPFLPFTSEKIFKLLNLEGEKISWPMPAEIVPKGHKLAEPFLLFEKIEDKLVEEQMQKLEDAKAKNMAEKSPVKEATEYDDFMKMDLRAATIIEAEQVPKTDKLMKLKLDVGFEQRTVVSGIAEYHKASDLIGQKVTLLANLKPRKLRGIESQGMILMAENKDGQLVFVSPGEDAENGASIS